MFVFSCSVNHKTLNPNSGLGLAEETLNPNSDVSEFGFACLSIFGIHFRDPFSGLGSAAQKWRRRRNCGDGELAETGKWRRRRNGGDGEMVATENLRRRRNGGDGEIVESEKLRRLRICGDGENPKPEC